MLRLPVCPHCHAVYTYKEVSDMHSGNMICYHCKKKFSVSKTKGKLLFMSAVCLLLIAANTAIMVTSENFVPVIIMLADAAVITAAIFMLPLTVRFRAEKFTKSEKREKKKEKRH